MEIPILQSLIDRTSNVIAEYEQNIQFFEQPHFYSDFEQEQADASLKYFKARLPKLVKIQKALKKEIALQIKVDHLDKVEEAHWRDWIQEKDGTCWEEE